MSELLVEGRRVSWHVQGAGPWLLAPECNFSWTSAMVDAMSDDFALIVASPSDFGTSDRLGEPYVPARWAADLDAVLDHLEVEECAVFGYSFTGAFGPWLARQLPNRIAAVAAGGFPLLGDYTVTADDVRRQFDALEADPGTYEVLHRDRFDPRAGVAFYDELSVLPDDALVDDSPCPLFCFWGDRDVDAVGVVMPSAELAAGLRRRSVPHRVIPGFDHEGLNDHLETAWPEVAAWLLSQLDTT